MQKLSNILASGNMTPKERIITQVKHYAHLEKTGIEILSESDIEALGNGWKPKHTGEVSEYNRSLKGIKIEEFMKRDILYLCAHAQLKIARVSRVLDYAMFSGYKNKYSQDILLADSHISKNDCDDFLITNSGFNYDYILEEFTKKKKEIDLQIKNNTLKVKIFEDEILELKRTVKLITSRSLNKLEDEHFLKGALKEQLEHYSYFAHVVLFIQKAELFKLYGDLLAVRDIYKVLIEIYETEIDFYLEEQIKELEEAIDQLNKEILFFITQMGDELFLDQKSKYLLDIRIKNILFQKPKKDVHGSIYSKYIEEFRKVFPYEFKDGK